MNEEDLKNTIRQLDLSYNIAISNNIKTQESLIQNLCEFIENSEKMTHLNLAYLQWPASYNLKICRVIASKSKSIQIFHTSHDCSTIDQTWQRGAEEESLKDILKTFGIEHPASTLTPQSVSQTQNQHRFLTKQETYQYEVGDPASMVNFFIESNKSKENREPVPSPPLQNPRHMEVIVSRMSTLSQNENVFKDLQSLA